MGDLAKTWDAAKKEFEKITGKSKPKPKGKIESAFNHTGLSKAIDVCDNHIAAIEKEYKDLTKKNKLIAAGKTHIKTIQAAATGYMKVLDDATKDEVADNAGAKTVYSKALKYLRAQLDSIEKAYEAKIANYEIAANTTDTASVKAVKMVHKSLMSTVAIAATGVKKIKAKPTVATFNEVFNTSDNVARKVQVQLIAADNGHKKNLLPEAARRRVDPRYVADLMTPWQAGGKGNAVADPNWTEKQVIDATAEFTKLLKLANAYLDDLDAALT
jgi:molecular chaperone GrpE (heat shock protein)